MGLDRPHSRAGHGMISRRHIRDSFTRKGVGQPSRVATGRDHRARHVPPDIASARLRPPWRSRVQRVASRAQARAIFVDGRVPDRSSCVAAIAAGAFLGSRAGCRKPHRDSAAMRYSRARCQWPSSTRRGSGVGNVDGRALGAPTEHLIPQAGIVGDATAASVACSGAARAPTAFGALARGPRESHPPTARRRDLSRPGVTETMSP